MNYRCILVVVEDLGLFLFELVELVLLLVFVIKYFIVVFVLLCMLSKICINSIDEMGRF